MKHSVLLLHSVANNIVYVIKDSFHSGLSQ